MDEQTKLILANGRVIEGGTAGQDDGKLWLNFTGFTMKQAANMMLDPAKTRKIIFRYGEMEDIYENFTDCVLLSISGGMIAACLTKGAR